MTELMIVALGLGVIAILLGVVLFQKLRKTKNSLERECHQQTQIGQRLALQYFTSEGLAQAESIPTGVKFSLQVVCQYLGWSFASYWEVDEQHTLLRCAGIWADQEERFQEFSKVIKTLSFAKGVDLPGAVWESGEPGFQHDWRRSRHSFHGRQAFNAGFHGGFAIPVFLEDRCTGVLEFLNVEPLAPTPGQLQLISSVGIQIGSFIERKRIERELRITQELYLRMADPQQNQPQIESGRIQEVGPKNHDLINLRLTRGFAHKIRISLDTMQNALNLLNRHPIQGGQPSTEFLRLAKEEVEDASRTIGDLLLLTEGKVVVKKEVSL